MPRNNGIYSPPSGTTAVSQTPISSAAYNNFVTDITADQNNPRPIIAGGTGAATAGGARTALGLGDAATRNVGTTAGTVAAGDDSRITGALPTRGSAVFIKADPYAPAFTKTGVFAVSIKAGTIIEVDGALYTFSSATAVTMPGSPVVGDYAIWIEPNGDLVASDSFSIAPVANSRLIGGFHYAPGGNATGYNTGGNTTPAINEFSLWDLKYRPSCLDPRGMTCVAGRFWRDIYHCGVDHHINGTSRYNVTMADGSSPPKVPVMFGGNGSTTYSTFNWWEAAEVMASHGKRLPTYDEFTTGAFGTTEASSGGTDPVSTILRAAYTSKWGIILASGNLYEWGWDFGGDHAAASWANTAGGRGQVYMQSNVARFGGYWDAAALSGSRASAWRYLPSDSADSVGARGCSDHLIHE